MLHVRSNGSTAKMISQLTRRSIVHAVWSRRCECHVPHESARRRLTAARPVRMPRSFDGGLLQDARRSVYAGGPALQEASALWERLECSKVLLADYIVAHASRFRAQLIFRDEIESHSTNSDCSDRLSGQEGNPPSSSFRAYITGAWPCWTRLTWTELTCQRTAVSVPTHRSHALLA